MAVTSPVGMGRTIPLAHTTTTTSYSLFKTHHHLNHSSLGGSVNLRQYFVGHHRFFNSKSTQLCCRCSINNNDSANNSSIDNVVNNNSNKSSSSTVSVNGSDNCSDWDWNRWTRHFSEIEQAESFSSVLRFQLEEAVEREDFQEAAKLKSAIAEATSKDTVAEIMSELKRAIAEERYHDASKLSKSTASGLVGWWIGSAKESDDPFGRLVRITPGVGKYIGRCYTPRQLVTASPGTTLFEIYVVKNPDSTYAMQVVYLQRSKGSAPVSANLQPKPTRESPNNESESSSTVGLDAQTNKDKSDKQDERVLNIEGATEEGIKSVINFLKDKIPGLKVKVMNVSVGEEVVDSDAVKQLTQEDSEEDTEDSDDEDDDLDETDSESDRLTMQGSSDTAEDDKDMDMKVFIGGIVHNEDDTSLKEEYARLPAQITDAEKNSFILHVPGIRSEESEVANYKVAALAAQGVSELMPADVAKAFLGSDKIPPKISRDVREIVKLAVSQAQKKTKLSEFTKFDRIKFPGSNLDPFDGLYVGAFGPYGTEIVQLRRKFGRWSGENESVESSEVEFFEYVEAVKLTGDLNVPAGQVTFRAKIGKGSRLSNRSMYPDELGVVSSYKGQGRIADFGFKNPKWVEGELLQLSGKGIGPYVRGADLGFLYIVPEQSFLVLFNRLNLPE